MSNPTRQRFRNRIRAVMTHINYLSFEGQARLAKEAGISPSAVSRLVRGESNPSFAHVLSLLKVFEKHLGKRIDPRDLLTMDGQYPTPSVCELCGCRGCLPEQFYNLDGTMKEQFKHIKSGEWSLLPEEGGTDLLENRLRRESRKRNPSSRSSEGER